MACTLFQHGGGGGGGGGGVILPKICTVVTHARSTSMCTFIRFSTKTILQPFVCLLLAPVDPHTDMKYHNRLPLPLL